MAETYYRVKPLTLVAIAGFMIFLSYFSVLPAHAQTREITEVDLHANGTAPFNSGKNVEFAANGSANHGPSIPGSAFSSGQVVLQGDPGTITATVAFEVYDGRFLYARGGEVSPAPNYMGRAAVTFTVDTSSGAVTASWSDPSGIGFSAQGTLTADGATATGNSGVSATANVDDRIITTCVAFTTGAKVCLNVMLVNKTTEPREPTAQELQQRHDAQNQRSVENYVGSIVLMTEQLSDVMLYQLPIIGALMDAKHQNESNRIFAETAAEAHRDYQPSEKICAFGTLTRSMTPSKFRVDDNTAIINTVLQKRELLNANMASSWGPFADIGSRLERYRAIYCDPKDNNGQIETAQMCASPFSLRRNKDIDYRRTISQPLTLNLDFSNVNATTRTADEEDVLALAKNLYSHKTFTVIPEQTLTPFNNQNQGTLREFQDTRSLSAVRSVIRNSYASIAAMKGRGTGLNAAQLKQIMQNLGVPAADINRLVGANPSYFAQMELISQKMFQDPNFYTDLYMGPANVARMKVVLQAVRLITDRDKFEEALRREMLISMLLEMRLRKLQGAETNDTMIRRSTPGQ